MRPIYPLEQNIIPTKPLETISQDTLIPAGPDGAKGLSGNIALDGDEGNQPNIGTVAKPYTSDYKPSIQIQAIGTFVTGSFLKIKGDILQLQLNNNNLLTLTVIIRSGNGSGIIQYEVGDKIVEVGQPYFQPPVYIYESGTAKAGVNKATGIVYLPNSAKSGTIIEVFNCSNSLIQILAQNGAPIGTIVKSAIYTYIGNTWYKI